MWLYIKKKAYSIDLIFFIYKESERIGVCMVSIESHIVNDKKPKVALESSLNLSEVKGIGAKTASNLISNGFTTIGMVASSTPEQLAQVPGIGILSAQKLIDNVRKYLEETSSHINKMEIKQEKLDLSNLKEGSSDIVQEGFDEEIELEHINSSRVDKFAEEMEYTLPRPSVISSNLKEIEFDPRDDMSSKTPNMPIKIQSDVSQIPNKSNPTAIRRPRVPYREAKINSHPHADYLFQRQQSAQKILRIIREAGLIEIPLNRPELREIFRAVDLLACKPMRGDNGRCIILLIPIKHVITKDPVYVWDSHVMTGVLNEDPTTAQNMAINTFTKKLLQASELLFSDMIDGNSLISLVAYYIGISMEVNLSFKNKRLYLGSGEIEYQVIIDPVLLCDTEVYCLEKTLPYAYQQESNLHVVPQDQLDELLDYLQKKYRLLARHNSSHNAVMKVDEVKTSTFKHIQMFSFPFIAYGILFSFFLLLGIQEIVRFCISLGFGLIFVYGGILSYLIFHHFQSLKTLSSEFCVPYHQRHVELSKEDFILINEQLSPEWMSQFEHEIESIGTTPKIKISKSIAKDKAKISQIKKPMNSRFLQNTREEEKHRIEVPSNASLNTLSYKDKYQAFLDD